MNTPLYHYARPRLQCSSGALPWAFLTLALACCPRASAQIEVVMVSSSVEGGISVSNDPQIANGGKIMFKGEREVGDDDVDGVYIGYAGGGVTPLVEVGSPGEFLEIEGAAMSSNGKVIFVATVLINVEQTGGIKPVREREFFSGSNPYEKYSDGTKPLGRADGPFAINDNLWTVSVVNGALVMGLTGQLVVGSHASAGTFYFPKAINNTNQIAFVHRLPDETLKTVKRAEFEPDGSGTRRLVVRPLADGFEEVDSLSLDDSGRAVFLGRLPGELSSTLYAATGAAQVLAREGDGQGFSNFYAVSVSAGGQIAFLATYESPSGDRRSGIFRGFNGAADKIVADGDRLTYNGAEWEISIGTLGPRGVNDSGQVVFSGSISPVETDGGGGEASAASIRPTSHSSSRSGLFVTSGVGDPPPDDEPPGDDPEDDPADTFTWVNNSGGAFATAANWEPAQVPVRNSERADTARFDLGANYTVDTPAAATEQLLVRGGDVTLNVGTYTVGSTDPSAPSVSITRSGILRVTGGTLQSVNTTIGHGSTLAGQVAEAHLFNSGVKWDNPGRMTVGGFSRGRLFVANGPTLTTGEARIGADARGEVIVGGTDSFWDAGSLAVGYAHEGSLIVESGGHTRAERLHIGRTGSDGTVTVDGAGSLLTVTESPLDFTVGESDGTGALVVRNGGRVVATGDAHLAVGFGSSASGSLLVEGFDATTHARSTLRLDSSELGYLVVGWTGGTGTAWIDDGALLETNLAEVGSAGGTGTVFIRGTGQALPSRWENTGTLTLGQDGTGALHVQSGGLVSTKHLHIGDGEGSEGVVTVNGVGPDGLPSLLRVSESAVDALVGSNGGHGELRIEAGGRVDLDPLGILQIGLSGGEGLVTVRGFDAGTGKRSTLELDRSSDVAGALVVAAGSLEIEDGGLARSRFGSIGFGGTTGRAVVSGAGGGYSSSWDIFDQLDVGVDHAGSLDIAAGGEVSTARVEAGSGANGQAVIRVRGVDADGIPSTLRVTDSRLDFDLGTGGGRATLSIENGGRVVAPGESWLSIERGEILVRGFDIASGTRSRLEVDGEGYGWLVLGGAGATLRIEDGARVHSQIGMLGLGGTISPTVYVGGFGLGQPAYWRIGSELEVGQPIGSGTSGTLTIAADGAVSLGEIDAVAGSLLIGNAGTLRGHGTIIAPGGVGVAGGVDNFAGTVAPGTSPGVLTIEGDYAQGAAGVLDIEIGGLESGYDYDQLVVTGDITFAPGAKIRITFIDPNPDDTVAEAFIPRTGDVFNFLIADAITLPAGATLGDLVEFTNLPSGVTLDFDLEVVNGTTRVKATTTAAPPATGWRIIAHPKSVVATAGAATTFTVELEGASGTTYQWRRNGVDLAGATGATYTLPSPQRFHTGDEYSVVITTAGTSATSKIATIAVVAAPASNARLLNLSTRGLAQSGDNVLIPGFVIQGTENKRLLIRAVGPTLADHGVDGVLADPTFTLHRMIGGTSQEITANDDWGANSNAAEIIATGAALGAFALPTGSADAALLVDLPPGIYTAVTTGVGGATGVAIVELYDADTTEVDSRLINISTRGFAGLGDEVMIPGFVVSPEGPKTLLVRVAGPGLGAYGVDGVMADPKLALFRREADGAQTFLFDQDNWSDNPDALQTAEVAAQVGAFPLAEGSTDAAFVVTLSPGVYSIVGSSAVPDGVGIVLVEVYVVP